MSAEPENTGERFMPSQTGDGRAEHLHRYRSVRDLVRGKDVLDLACGEGYGSTLLSHFALSVTGVDIDEQTIRRARTAYSDRPNVRFEVGSCDSVPLPDRSVDV